MRLSRRTILSVIYPLALVLLLLNIVAAFRCVRELGVAADRVRHCQEVLAEVNGVLAAVREGESGQRGYLLTGQEVYLAPYEEANRVLPRRLEHLEALTKGNPFQNQQAETLKDLIAHRLAVMVQVVTLRRDDKRLEAIQVERNGQGRRLIEHIHDTSDAMKMQEQGELDRLTRTSRTEFRTMARSIVFATLLAFACLILAMILRRRELAERDRQAEAIRQSEARLATTFLSIGDAVISTDEIGRIQLMNPVAEELTGYTRDEAEGRPIEEILRLVSETTRKRIPNPVSRVIRHGLVIGMTDHTLLVTRDGSEIPIDDSAAPIKDASGKLLGAIIVFRDVTERRRDEAERERLHAAERAALAQAEEANRAKDRFLAVLSHELRTPLNPIMLAVTSMLTRPIAPEDVGPTLEMIRENVALEARLIDDLLDVMRIASGKMSLHLSVVDVHRLLRHALQVCQSDLQGRELSVVVDLAATNHFATADATRLEQVFWNLIKNAVKFTPPGGTIMIRSWNDPGGDEVIQIEVADTGIGIEPTALRWIFDPFHQGERSITRQFGGMGLGLAISHGIVEAHGGGLSANSAGKNQGTRFRVTLKVDRHVPNLPAQPAAPKVVPPLFASPEIQAQSPPETGVEADAELTAEGNAELAVEAEAEVHAPSAPQPSELRILLVEDEPTTLLVMTRLLRRLGYEVTTASTVQEALQVANEAEFDMLVSDIGLPDGSGLDLIRRLSADRVLPAIALTGFGMQEDVRLSREAGFAAHLTKPIDFAKLVSTIRQVAGRAKEHEPERV